MHRLALGEPVLVVRHGAVDEPPEDRLPVQLHEDVGEPVDPVLGRDRHGERDDAQAAPDRLVGPSHPRRWFVTTMNL